MFPESFNPSIYKKLNPDLEKLNTEQLSVHYKAHGIDEGRIANEITDRNLFKKYINTSKLSCLEIGPFDDPVIKGKNVNPNAIVTLVYLLILIFGNYFLNLNISSTLCGVPQWGNTFLFTLIKTLSRTSY